MKRVRLITVVVLAAATCRVAAAQTPVHLASRIDTASATALLRADRAFAAQRWREAADLYQGALPVDDGVPRRWLALGHALFEDNRHRESIAAYERALQLGAEPAVGAWEIARAYALDGNRKQALRWLAHAMSAGFDDRDAIRGEPAFAPYHADPRFMKLVQSTGAAGFEPATSRVTAGRSAN